MKKKKTSKEAIYLAEIGIHVSNAIAHIQSANTAIRQAKRFINKLPRNWK